MRDAVEDLHFRPLGEGLEWLRQLPPRDVLLLGRPTQSILKQLASLGAALRTADTDLWVKVFMAGAYAMRDADLDSATLRTFGRKRRTKQFAAHLAKARALH